MFEIKGKYNSCKVFTDNCENECISQLTNLMNQSFVENSKVRIMPDTHAGKGCVIGTTMTIHDKVVPNLVGVDIGCFSGDTKVWLYTGRYETIKSLAEKGTEFYTESWDKEIDGFVGALATAFKTRENAELVRVTYGSKFPNQPSFNIRCTLDHKFLVSENHSVSYYHNDDLKWIEAKDLKEGMRLVAEDNFIYVKDVEKLEEREDVYCLNVPEYHNFMISAGVIVHNCGMLAVKLKEKRVDLPKLDSVIREYVPSGMDVHVDSHEERTSLVAKDLTCYKNASINEDRAYKSVGTLGGGNHFIELDKDSNENLWLVVHTGSRHLGIEVCDYYQKLAYEDLKVKHNGGSLNELKKELIAKLKAENREKDIQKELKKLTEKYNNNNPKIPYELAYLEGQHLKDYLHDMKMVQEHAVCNRAEIARLILKYAKLHEIERFETIHNYIDMEHMILRKGSVSAQKGERLLIPINMRDGSLICTGKGNEDWNCSAPHGAGRLMSRSSAKENISINEFKKSMEGIYTTSVNIGTIDESPMAYKPMEEIIKNIEPTVEINDIIKPIYNFKASEI